MFAPITKILLCLVLCLGLLSCPSQTCRSYQDVARVALPIIADIDSVAMIVNDSILGCGNLTRKVVGSKTHQIRFPINVRIQLFSQGGLWKELFFEIDKKTVSKVSYGVGCSGSSRSPSIFLEDDYCLYIENMGDFPGYDYDSMSCIESGDGKQDICSM